MQEAQTLREALRQVEEAVDASTNTIMETMDKMAHIRRQRSESRAQVAPPQPPPQALWDMPSPPDPDEVPAGANDPSRKRHFSPHRSPMPQCEEPPRTPPAKTARADGESSDLDSWGLEREQGFPSARWTRSRSRSPSPRPGSVWDSPAGRSSDTGEWIAHCVAVRLHDERAQHQADQATPLSPTQPYTPPTRTPCRHAAQPSEVLSFILQWDPHFQLLRSFMPSDTWMLTVATLCRHTELAIHPHTRSLRDDYGRWCEGLRNDACSNMCALSCKGGAGKHVFANPKQGHGWPEPHYTPWLEGQMVAPDEQQRRQPQQTDPARPCFQGVGKRWHGGDCPRCGLSVCGAPTCPCGWQDPAATHLLPKRDQQMWDF